MPYKNITSKQYKKEWLRKNPGYMKAWQDKNLDKMRTYRKEWVERNKEWNKECHKKYYYKDLEESRKKHREYQRKRLGCLPREEYFNKIRKPLTEWKSSKTNPRLKARELLLRAVHNKRIIKPSQCSQCKEELNKALLQGHHKDYDKWWEVEWLCTKCHIKAHNGSYFSGKNEHEKKDF